MGTTLNSEKNKATLKRVKHEGAQRVTLSTAKLLCGTIKKTVAITKIKEPKKLSYQKELSLNVNFIAGQLLTQVYLPL